MTPTTTEGKDVQTVKTASIIALLAGIWFFLSPWVYGVMRMGNAWNSWIVGALMVGVAAVCFGNPLRATNLSWVNCLLGIWAFISPWIFGYTTEHGRFVNSLCVGVIAFIVSLVSAAKAHHHHTTPPVVTRT